MENKLISVLVIEDESVIRQSMVYFLEDSGYQVYQAENGKTGIDKFEQFLPDVVLSDLRMPEMNGIEVLSTIKELSPRTPVIIVSGTGDISDAINTIHLGASDFILKPVQDLSIILHSIDNVVEKARLIQENKIYRENLEIARKIADRDMQMAINVQKKFLPDKILDLNNYDISFHFRPMAGVSGDFYDFYSKNDKLEGAALFDVSGHGIASGMITMLAKPMVFRNFIENRDLELNHLLEKINSDLISEIDEVDNFLTGILLRFKNNMVEYVNAGHPALLHKISKENRIVKVGESENFKSGAFLGVSILESEYNVFEFEMSSGDSLLLYSDCLIESMKDDDIIYGMDRLVNVFDQIDGNLSSEKIIDVIIDDLELFVKKKIFMDDLTLMVIKKL